MNVDVESQADWFVALQRRLAEGAGNDRSLAATPDGIWAAARKNLTVMRGYPQVDEDVIVRELKDSQAPYYVLKNTKHSAYMKLSVEERQLFSRMDGQTSIEGLVYEHFAATNSLAPARVTHLVEQLYQRHMLTEKPVTVWSQINQAIQKRSWLYRISYPARLVLTRRFDIQGLDGFISWLYRVVGRYFFTPVAKIIFLAISILGLLAFFNILQDPRHVFLGDNIIQGLALLWLVAIFPVVIHELGHALTVKHFGRQVPRGGVMLFFGMPAAFVETTDIWLEPRRARLAVTWNGPYTGLIIGGMASVTIYLFPELPLKDILFKLAGFAYLTVFFNVNPLLKLDGYYLLSDALDIPSLRERSVSFVRKKLVGHLLARKKFNREEWIYTSFGILSILWSVYVIYLLYFFWQTRLRAILEMWLGRGYPVLAQAFSLVLLAALVSFAILLLLNLYRLGLTLLARFVQRGSLERHGQLALLGIGVSLILGAGLPLMFSGPAARLIGVIAMLASMFVSIRLVIFNRPYGGSKRGLVHLGFALSLFLAGLAHSNQLQLPLQFPANLLFTTISLIMIASGLILTWPPYPRLGLFSIMLGLAAGGLMTLILSRIGAWPASSPGNLILSTLIAVGVWASAAVKGSGRMPAVMLIYLGGVLIMGAWLIPMAWDGLQGVGILLMAAGGLHLIYARLPRLSRYDIELISSHTSEAVRASLEILVRRMIAQVFFESGFRGVWLLGEKFTESMRRLGVEISIVGNQFEDRKSAGRTVVELTHVYGIVFDELYRLISREFGREMTTLAFGYGFDLLPWQHREVIGELVFSRRPWGQALNQKVLDAKDLRRQLLKRVPLFVDCSGAELDKIGEELKTERFASGEVIVQQGDPGDKFYIIESGNLTIWQRNPDGIEVLVDRVGPGHYFGEVALVTNAPRNATVRAETPVVLLSLLREDFERLVKKHVILSQLVNKRVKHSWLLRGMPVFDELDSRQLESLAERLQTEEYKAGEVVTNTGDPGDKFYIVESGELVVGIEVAGNLVELSRRGPGEYVGEIALLENRPRTASLIAAEDTQLLSLQADYFRELVANYISLGQTLSLTGSRRLSFIEMARESTN